MTLINTFSVSRSSLRTHLVHRNPSCWAPRQAHVGVTPTRSTSWLSFASFGLVLTGAVAYVFYSTTSVFPASIKKPLREALRAERKAELQVAEVGFRNAYELAKREVERMDWLKRSGIAIRWAAMLEDANREEDACTVYATVYQDLREASDLTAPERMRAVAVAQKLALLSRDDDEVERYLTWSVEEILRLTLPQDKPTHHSEPSTILMGELDLPEWATGAQVGPCLEALGEFYARKGRPHYALPLYLQALSVLLPPPPRQSDPSLSDRCHAATLMNNIAQLVVHPNMGPSSSVKDATSWASRALGVAQAALAIDSSTKETHECIAVQLVAFQNLGTLAEMEGNQAKARAWFGQAQDQAESLGVVSVSRQAQESLKRLGTAAEKIEGKKEIVAQPEDPIHK